MITKGNFKELLVNLGFSNKGDTFSKKFRETDAYLKANFNSEKLIYPIEKGLVISGQQTSNFSQNENFVVFECVHRLFEKGYHPSCIELEQTYSKIKKDDGGGRADIVLKNYKGDTFVIIECKTPVDEFNKHWKKTEQDGDQLFRYLVNKRETKYLCLYSVGVENEKIKRHYHLLSLIDNDKYLDEIKESNPLSFKEALSKNKEDIFKVWKETYHLDFITNGLFEDDIAKYEIGKTKHTVEELKPISENDIQGKYHEFATILRQHNVSGRENATYRVFSLQGKLYNNLLNLPAFDGFDDEIEIWLAFNGYMNTR